jgi:predicted nucleic acid-binding protein
VKVAVDTSVLLDVLTADPKFGEASRVALRSAYDSGALTACDVVWAEVQAAFPSEDTFLKALRALGVRFEPVSAEAAATAGRLWRESRRRSRGPRARVVADFLVGAHALHQADALLTRDRGFYRSCFERLHVLDPSSPDPA